MENGETAAFEWHGTRNEYTECEREKWDLVGSCPEMKAERIALAEESGIMLSGVDALLHHLAFWATFMRTILASLAIAIVPIAASAALPPVYQNESDLNVMVEFARSHPLVLESLRAIDLERRLVLYRDTCMARFERPRRATPMPGPAPALRYVGSNCPIQAAESTPSH